jgi:hypothetical protein
MSCHLAKGARRAESGNQASIQTCFRDLILFHKLVSQEDEEEEEEPSGNVNDIPGGNSISIHQDHDECNEEKEDNKR